MKLPLLLLLHLLQSSSSTPWTLISSSNGIATLTTPLTQLSDVTLEIKSPAGAPTRSMAVNLVHREDDVGLWEYTAVFMWDTKVSLIELECLTGVIRDVEYRDTGVIKDAENHKTGVIDEDIIDDSDKVWSWRFKPTGITLSCNGVVLYSLEFTGEDAQCKKSLETAVFNEITFLYMANKEYRVLYHVTPARDCWTPECGYCTNTECAVRYDDLGEGAPITATSLVTRTGYNTLILYDEQGTQLGTFKWSLSRIHLVGCIACRLPWRRLRHLRKTRQEWTVSLSGEGVVTLIVAGDVVYQHTLSRGCLRHYSRVRDFAFCRLPSPTSFAKLRGMQLGTLV